jgi:hypothetical protein
MEATSNPFEDELQPVTHTSVLFHRGFEIPFALCPLAPLPKRAAPVVLKLEYRVAYDHVNLIGQVVQAASSIHLSNLYRRTPLRQALGRGKYCPENLQPAFAMALCVRLSQSSRRQSVCT